MKKLTTKMISFILTLIILASVGVTSFADTGEVPTRFNDGTASYVVIDQTETPYGTAYYVKKDSGKQARTVWDVADVVMAGLSWADLFAEPSWGNFGWAVLDTAALLPVLPSSAYFRKGGKTLLKIDEVAKFAKTSEGKKAVKAAMQAYKYSDGITSKAIKEIKKSFKGKEAEKVLQLFKDAADKGLVGATNQTGIKKLSGSVDKIYTHEIKVTGEYGSYRIFGYKDSSGKWVFDNFKKAHK